MLVGSKLRALLGVLCLSFRSLCQRLRSLTHYCSLITRSNPSNLRCVAHGDKTSADSIEFSQTSSSLLRKAIILGSGSIFCT
ncbi:hypothetical protein BJ165DRAFT_1492463 [Panaeolus papilionaceus]|nr:hypothetical protein BJ165DRAFT_1492463 [Panaeolus papilionaceus]